MKKNYETRIERCRHNRKKTPVLSYFLFALDCVGRIVALGMLLSFLSWFFDLLAICCSIVSDIITYIINSCLTYSNGEDIMDITKCKLFGIQSKKVLSKTLKIELFKLKNIEDYFTSTPFHKITNKGKKRTLYNPSHSYKEILIRMNYFLQQINLPTYVNGGIKKRDYILNASVHKDNKFFLLLDLKDFFPSTSDYYVYNFFRFKLKMSEDIAKICMLLTTEQINKESNVRHLPQGYSTSPILSYLSYLDMYNGINKLAFEKGLTFSCYYDDLTFSSPSYISKSIKKQVIDIIQRFNLNINKSKTLLMKNEFGLTVTGTFIGNGEIKAPNNLQNKMFKLFNELVRKYESGMFHESEILTLCNKVQGCVSAIKSIEKGREFSSITNKVKQIRNSYRRVNF